MKHKKTFNKKSQIQLTFHWIYILIAGAVILLFFAGIVVKQKAVAEKSLQQDVVRILESILVGAGVSEKTKTSVDISGLADYTLEFKCEEGLGTFGIKGGASGEIPLEPIFAPLEIETSRLVLWSLPYKLPYKIMDLLVISSINTKYFVVGDDGTGFRAELEKSLTWEEGEKAEFNFDFTGEIDPGKNFQVRIVDLDGEDWSIKEVPGSLVNWDDKRVTLVSFSGKQATYFQKEGENWKRLDEVGIISIAEEGDTRNAAKYAAIFAADGENYKCNMLKVFRRMEYVNEVYGGKIRETGGKLKEIIDYHQTSYQADPTNTKHEVCLSILTRAGGMGDTFKLLQSKVVSCVLENEYGECRVETEAGKLRELNEQAPNDLDLQSQGCITLY